MTRKRFYHTGVSDDLNTLITVMNPSHGKSYLTFSAHGSGEAAICLATMGSDKVVAYDLEDAEAMSLMIDIKFSIAKLFNRIDSLVLLGLRYVNKHRRKSLTQMLLDSLTGEQKLFWTERRMWLESGLFHADKIRQFFYAFKTLLWLLSPNEAYNKMLYSSSTDERNQLFQRYVARPWIKWILSVIGKRVNLFFPTTLWTASEFPKQVNREPMGYLEQIIRSGLADNPLFAHYVRDRLESLPENLLPPHLMANNFDMMREKADCIKVNVTRPGVANLLQFNDHSSFDGAYISNIIDYLNSNERDIFFKRLRANLKNGAPLLVYSNESYSKVPNNVGFVYNSTLSKKIEQTDRARVYNLKEVYMAT